MEEDKDVFKSSTACHIILCILVITSAVAVLSTGFNFREDTLTLEQEFKQKFLNWTEERTFCLNNCGTFISNSTGANNSSNPNRCNLSNHTIIQQCTKSQAETLWHHPFIYDNKAAIFKPNPPYSIEFITESQDNLLQFLSKWSNLIYVVIVYAILQIIVLLLISYKMVHGKNGKCLSSCKVPSANSEGKQAINRKLWKYYFWCGILIGFGLLIACFWVHTIYNWSGIDSTSIYYRNCIAKNATTTGMNDTSIDAAAREDEQKLKPRRQHQAVIMVTDNGEVCVGTWGIGFTLFIGLNFIVYVANALRLSIDLTLEQFMRDWFHESRWMFCRGGIWC